MNERQLRMLRWLSAMLDRLANPELRNLLDEKQLEALLRQGKIVINAELALETTKEIEEVGVAKDVAELEKLFSL